MNSAQCGPVLLPESTLQSKHDFSHVNPVFLRKALLYKSMIGIQTVPVMSRTKRYR
jgi:hypothetical protein